MKKIVVFFCCCCLILSSCATSSEKLIKKVSKNLTSYSMDITYTDDHTMQVTQQVDYINSDDTLLTELYFHLYANSFKITAINKPVNNIYNDKAYPNGFSEGKIDIFSLKVEGEDSEIIVTGDDGDFLKVVLPEGLAPDDRVKIDLQYMVTVPNCNHRFGYGDNTINLANFYPIVAVYDNGWVLEGYHSNGDPFYSDVANYNVKVNYPTTYTLAHTGSSESKAENNGVTTQNLNARAVRDFAMVLSDKFKVISGKAGDVEVKYYYYNDEHAEASLQAGIDSINTFSELFGEYPYSTYSVVKTNFIHGGMEYPNLVYISDAVAEKADYLNVIIHETAHQWWYGLVGSNAYEYGWLDEGLTDYSTALFYRNNESYGVNYEQLMASTLDSYHVFVDIYDRIVGKIDTSMNRKICDYASEAEYVYMTYVKGALLFDSICENLGYNKFIKVLQKYFDAYKFTNVTPDHFIGILEKVSKREMRGFVNSWLEGNVVL